MGLPARLLKVENPMEERVARLEVKVDHIQSDVSELKTDVRRLDEKIDKVEQKFTAKIDAMDQKFTAKIDTILEMIVDLKVGRALDRVWWLLMSAALLGVMARAFKWI
jgi:phage shock protein A